MNRTRTLYQFAAVLLVLVMALPREILAQAVPIFASGIKVGGTIASKNTTTFLLTSDAAITGGVDTGIVARVLANFSSNDRVFLVQDASGPTDLFWVYGDGRIESLAGMLATGLTLSTSNITWTSGNNDPDITSNASAGGGAGTAGLNLRVIQDFGVNDRVLRVSDNGGTTLFEVYGDGTAGAQGDVIAGDDLFMVGDRITLGAVGSAVVIDGLYTGTGTAAYNFESAMAAGAVDITKPAYLFDVQANLGSGDYHSTWRDTNTTVLMSLTGAGVLSMGTSPAGGAQIGTTGFTLITRAAIRSALSGVITFTNSAANDLDQATFGPDAAADIGVVTLSLQNTGVDGNRLLCNTAASGLVDRGCIFQVVGDLGSSDIAFEFLDNNGASTLFKVAGDGGVTAPGNFVLGASSFTVFGSGSKSNITEGSAQSILLVNLPASAHFGATVHYTVTDSATDFIARSGIIQIQGANKAGVETCTIATTRDQETEDGSSAAVSGGALTLTYTWTLTTTPTNGCNLALNAASSAGANTYDIAWTITLNGTSSSITVVPQ
jgi:hypothetical protein